MYHADKPDFTVVNNSLHKQQISQEEIKIIRSEGRSQYQLSQMSFLKEKDFSIASEQTAAK